MVEHAPPAVEAGAGEGAAPVGRLRAEHAAPRGDAGAAVAMGAGRGRAARVVETVQVAGAAVAATRRLRPPKESRAARAATASLGAPLAHLGAQGGAPEAALSV